MYAVGQLASMRTARMDTCAQSGSVAGRPFATALLLAAAVQAVLPLAGGTAPRPPCNLNGVLTGSVCECDAAWAGSECETLAVLPTPKNGGYHQSHTSSWGGNAVYDSVNGVYHGFFSEMVLNCGLSTCVAGPTTTLCELRRGL
jgi:hypothetical protein